MKLNRMVTVVTCLIFFSISITSCTTLLSQKLGGMLSPHSKFLNEMNRLINQFSEKLTVEILEKGL